MTHNRTLRATDIPCASAIAAGLPGAQFFDALQVADPDPQASALQSWLELIARTPRWVDRLMRLRDTLVGPFGIRPLTDLPGQPPTPPRPASAYRVGDLVGVFRIRSLHHSEVLFGADDRHLNAQISLLKHAPGAGAQPLLVLSTVVHIHNAFGHVYMAAVKPLHRRIGRALLTRVPEAAPAARRSAGHGAR